MASEILKRKSLINRLKEPDVPVINFDLINSAKDYNIESIEEDILPAPKPKELFEERDRLRIESLEQSLQDTKPFLMDESVDFIEREEFSKGGFAELTRLLNNLPDGTEVTRDMVQKLIDDNDLDVSVRNYFARPSKNLKEGITLSKRMSPVKITDELLESVDNYIKNTPLNLKQIGEDLGYKPTKKGQSGQLRSTSPLIKEYEAKYGKIPEGRFKPYKLIEGSDYVQNIIKLRETLGSTNAVADELGLDSKTIRNVLSQFRPDLMGDVNVPGPDTGAKAQKKRRILKEKEGTKQLSKSEKLFNKNQERLVKKLNNDFKKNPNKVLNNPKLINLLNLKLENGNIVSKNKTKKQILESINRQGGLLDIEHIADIATGKKNVQFPVNRQITTYNVNSGFLRSVANYVNKPNADPDKIANIEKTLKEYGLRVKTNKGTIGAPMISAEDNIKRNLTSAGIDLPKDTPIDVKGSGQKKLTALQEIMQGGKTMGVNPELAIRAGKEEFVDPLLRTGARGLRGAATIGDFLISAGPGAKGLGLGLLLEADPIVTGMSEGKTFGQTARDTFVGSAIDAIPGVNLGSLGEDLIKLAQTEGQKMSAQNLIDYQKDYDRFLKDRNAFLSYQDLSQSELDELGFDNESLINLERDLINRFKDIQTRAPKVYNPQNLSNITELARKAAEQRYKNLKTGIAGKIFGDRMAKDPEFIDKQAQQILAAFTGVEGATDSFADSYKNFLGFTNTDTLSPEELDETFDMEGGIMAANGGRIGFAEGPMDPKRRLFMKIMGGIMSLPFVSKFVGKSDLAKPVVKLSGTTTNMPDWFPDFVNKMMFTTGGKKIDADVMEYTTPKLPGVKMLRNDEGQIIVEGKNAYGEPYEIIYRPPGYELVDETTGKAVKIPGEFKASDTQFRRTGPEIDDYDVDYETVKDVDDILGGDSTKLEGFAKGTGETKYTKGQKEIDMAEAEGTRADVDEGPDIDLSDYED